MNRRRGDGRAGLGVAATRLALMPVIFVAERLIDYPGAEMPWQNFDLVFGAATAYSILALIASVRSPWRPLGGWLPYGVADSAFLFLLTWQTGGAESELRVLLAAVPFAAAFLGRPRETGLFVLAMIGVYSLAAAIHQEDTEDADFVIGQALLLVWRGVLALALCVFVSTTRERLANLASERQQLLARTHEAVEKERERLAYALHDDAVQSLHAAQLQLSRAGRGDPGALEAVRAGIAHAITRLRDAIADLRPGDLDRLGLVNALEQTASRLADERPVRIELVIAPHAAGPHDAIVYAVARELLINAVNHAAATEIALNLSVSNGVLRLCVEDDGQGFLPRRRGEAIAQGHIGLAACAERIEATDGHLRVESSPEDGTRIIATLPIGGEAAAA